MLQHLTTWVVILSSSCRRPRLVGETSFGETSCRRNVSLSYLTRVVHGPILCDPTQRCTWLTDWGTASQSDSPPSLTISLLPLPQPSTAATVRLKLTFIGTARTVSGAGSMKRYGVRPLVRRPSVCPCVCPSTGTHTSKLLYVLNSGSDRYADAFRLADTIYAIFIRCDKRTSNNKHGKQSQNDVQYKAAKPKKTIKTISLDTAI